MIATRLIGHYPPYFALGVFRQLQSPNIFPFNAAIRVLAEEGLFSLAFCLFNNLKHQSLAANDLTFSFLLKACIRSGDAHSVGQVHTHIVKTGFATNSFVCNGLLNVYAKGLKDLVSGHKVFNELPQKDMVNCWTPLIAGCAQSGQPEEALQLFILVVKENLKPADDTVVSVLSACSRLCNVEIEKWIKVLLTCKIDVKSGNPIADSINTILVYLYGKLGKVGKSRESFDEIAANGKRCVLPWNAMIGTYMQNSFPMEAISLFLLMVASLDCRPNHVTMVNVLSACTQVGNIDLGTWVHRYIELQGSKGVLETNPFLATALIDMYSKCGQSGKANGVFNRMVSKDVVSFNAMIMGHAINSEGKEALKLFDRMQEIGLHPNAVTLLGVLCACSHSGLLEQGQQIFRDISQRYSVSPMLEHYACYIDLLARFGLIKEAFEVAASMPFEPNNFVWGALLGGCLLHSRIELAQDVSKRLVEVDPESSGGYVMMSNAFAGGGQWQEVSGLRWAMSEKRVKKQPGHSWISINGAVHEFLVGSPSHPEIERIYHMLDGLAKQLKVASL